MKIAAPLRTTAKSCGLRDWFDSKKVPREEYFALVDRTRSMYESLAAVVETGVTWEMLAKAIAMVVDEEGVLYDYVASVGKDTEKADEWSQICEAFAWVILDRYEAAVEDGTWERGSGVA